jgi:hypothetical protein
MTQWVIVIPAWGDRCVRCTRDFGIPSIKIAMKRAKLPFRFHVYTDQRDKLAPSMVGLQHKFFDPPTPQGTHRMLGLVHGHALRNAKPGDMLAFFNGDFAVSAEIFAACEARFDAGKRLIMCTALRSTSDIGPPIGETSRELLAWILRNPHIQTAECIWGNGRSNQPSVLLFVNGENVTVHAFHLHPFAVHIDTRNMEFQGHTIDDDMPMLFKREEVHVVVDADEMSIAEMSPPDLERWKLYPSPMMIKHVAVWAKQRTKKGKPFVNDMHKWFFSHAIRVAGHGDANERERVAEILAEV